ncbi:hypothetical protein [Halomonas denitrificans]|nr:hypothetical protein [Halomonas denitrificans]
MRLIAELKRRKVFRVAAAYAVVAWGLAQVADLVLENTTAPPWVMQVILLMLALGFPLAVILAWAFEVTPEGVKRTESLGGNERAPAMAAPDYLLVGMLLAVIVVAGFQLTRMADPAIEPTATPAATAGEAGADTSTISAASIAVLPFADLSPIGDQEYFSDGIAEEILNVLAAIDGLRVASRTSSFLYKDPSEPIPTIAEALGVAHVLEGSVRKSGNRIRITAQLIRADSDAHLWSDTYDRELSADTVFAIQDEIAQAIVDALRNELGLDIQGEVRVASDTESLDAYEIYLRAREMFRDRSDLPEAFALFERAVEIDPDFARAWEGMAAVGAVIEDWGFVDRPYRELAATAADRALELDPGLSMPWAVRGLLEFTKRPIDFKTSLGLIQRALDADPDNASALLWGSIQWTSLGFFDRAIAAQDRCLAIDPAYENCRRFKALALQLAGRSDEALDAFLVGVGNGFVTNQSISFIQPLLERGRRAEAMLLMTADDLSPDWQRAMLEFQRTGRPAGNVRDAIAESEPLRRHYALHYLTLGAYDLAADMDETSETTLLHWHPALPGLRNSEAFKRMLHAHGVPDYWRDHEYPPQCRPILNDAGEDDFECD